MKFVNGDLLHVASQIGRIVQYLELVIFSFKWKFMKKYQLSLANVSEINDLSVSMYDSLKMYFYLLLVIVS